MKTLNLSILALLLASIAVAAQPRSATQRLVDQLTLTPDQKTKLDPILADDSTKLRAIRNDATISADDKKTRSTEIRKDTDAKLKSILTDSQWKSYLDLKEQR